MENPDKPAPNAPQNPDTMSAEPTILLTDNKNLPTNPDAKIDNRSDEEKLWDGLVGIFKKKTNTELNCKTGFKQLLSVSIDLTTPEFAGWTRNQVIGVCFKDWLATRNITGLTMPLTVFVKEFPKALGDLRAVIAKEQVAITRDQARKELVHQVEESKVKVAEWGECFAAVLAADLNGCMRGTSEWQAEVEKWLQEHPAPAELHKVGDKLVQSEAYADRWIRSKVAYAMQDAMEVVTPEPEPFTVALQPQSAGDHGEVQDAGN